MEIEKPNISRGETVLSETRKCQTPCGNIFITIGYEKDFGPIEMFVATKGLKADKQINCDWALNAIAMGASHMLQGGFNSTDVSRHVNNFICPAFSMNGLSTCPEFMQSGLNDMIKKLKEEITDAELCDKNENSNEGEAR